MFKQGIKRGRENAGKQNIKNPRHRMYQDKIHYTQ
jgi:hypothetical protein